MRLDLRLVVPAVVCWVSAGILVTFPGVGAVVGAASWFFAIACLGALLVTQHASRRRPENRQLWGTLMVCGATAGLMAAVIGVAAPARLPDAVRVAAARHQTVDITATVWSLPVAVTGGVGAGVAGRVRFRATMTSLSGAHGSDAPGSGLSGAAVPLLVFAPTASTGEEGAAAPRIGETVRLVGTLRLTDPGDSASALLFATSRPTVLADAGWVLRWAGDLRSGFSRDAALLPGDGGDLLPGLAIGDTTSVSPELDDAMKASSLSHLTAVSGANCAVVIAAIMLLGRRLRRGMRIALSLVALGGFVVLVTPEPSVLRSAVMAAVTLLSIGAGRPGRGVPTLALSAILLLLLDPWLSRNYGFALSVLATAGLLVLAGPLSRLLARWMPPALAVVISIPLAAQLACQPVLLLLNPTLALYGVPANLLAAPAAPVATVIGLLGCLANPLLPGISAGLVHVAWLPSAWIAAVARTTATLPGNRLPWLEGVPGAVALALLTVLALWLILRRRDRPSRRWSAAALAVLLTCSGAYAGTLVGAGIGRAAHFPAGWQIAACDIGQGDAVVVREEDRYALVDVGPDPGLLGACLATLGISRINLLVLTHYDLDHVGGLSAVIGRVDTALVGVPENAQDAGLHEQLVRGGATVLQAAQGDHGTLGGLDWRVLWPIRGSTRMQVGNPGSVTIEFAGRGIRSVFLGDLGEEAQKALLRSDAPGRVEVVKVAHHGSADQSPDFYAALGARVGLVSVGARNTYGHPTKRLLDILGEVGTRVERTDLRGMIVVSQGDDGSLLVWGERAASDARIPRKRRVGRAADAHEPGQAAGQVFRREPRLHRGPSALPERRSLGRVGEHRENAFAHRPGIAHGGQPSVVAVDNVISQPRRIVDHHRAARRH
ncbi:competence protein ComEC [Cryobacterium psychrophilum]|uniref:MBL fold metallo-hydrolase n=1 Tax=Cryobacterium psychrophilum TaxID=41988 RepID=A0A4Y8KR87_9MICO|nr:competence protein ComEC [Cryobacterium psychrophilum]TFD79321.1 MBL fold metallo-hydrolase [Cryobacterium psychrophilum]